MFWVSVRVRITTTTTTTATTSTDTTLNHRFSAFQPRKKKRIVLCNDRVIVTTGRKNSPTNGGVAHGKNSRRRLIMQLVAKHIIGQAMRCARAQPAKWIEFLECYRRKVFTSLMYDFEHHPFWSEIGHGVSRQGVCTAFDTEQPVVLRWSEEDGCGALTGLTRARPLEFCQCSSSGFMGFGLLKESQYIAIKGELLIAGGSYQFSGTYVVIDSSAKPARLRGGQLIIDFDSLPRYVGCHHSQCLVIYIYIYLNLRLSNGTITRPYRPAAVVQPPAPTRSNVVDYGLVTKRLLRRRSRQRRTKKVRQRNLPVNFDYFHPV